MSVSSIAFGNNPVSNKTQATQKKPTPPTLREELAKEGINLPKLTPMQSAIANSAMYFGSGFLIDRGLGLMVKNFKTPLKLSLALNGAVGLVAGVVTYIREKTHKN